eukprot:gene8310-5824_t
MDTEPNTCRGTMMCIQAQGTHLPLCHKLKAEGPMNSADRENVFYCLLTFKSFLPFTSALECASHLHLTGGC